MNVKDGKKYRARKTNEEVEKINKGWKKIQSEEKNIKWGKKYL